MIIKDSFCRFCTWPRFKTEACGISEMAICSLKLFMAIIGPVKVKVKQKIKKKKIFRSHISLFSS